MNRITYRYMPGNGDNGYSNLLQGIQLRKDNDACHIQGIIEECRNKIQKVLTCEDIVLDELEYILQWLNTNLFSLAAFCYQKGDSPKHQFPLEMLSYLDGNIKRYKAINQDCPDFTIQSNPKLIEIDAVRIQIRKLERYYIAWWHSEVVSNYLMNNTHLIEDVQKHSSIINRLSAFIFEAIRIEAKTEQEKGNLIEISYWQNKVEQFLPPNGLH